MCSRAFVHLPSAYAHPVIQYLLIYVLSIAYILYRYTVQSYEIIPQKNERDLS